MKVVVALKRERQGDPQTENWQDQVASTPGVSKVWGKTARRMQVEADERGFDLLQSTFSHVAHIERVVERTFRGSAPF